MKRNARKPVLIADEQTWRMRKAASNIVSGLFGSVSVSRSFGASRLATPSTVTIEAHIRLFGCSANQLGPGDRQYERRSTSASTVKPLFGAGRSVDDPQVATEKRRAAKFGNGAPAAEALGALEETEVLGATKREQADQEPDYVNEEDLSTETDAVWQRLQPLKAILWAAGIAGTELEALALMLPQVQQVMKLYLALSDPRPITSSLINLVTAYRARVQGASYTTSNEIDPQMVLSIVLKHLAVEGELTAQIAERVARFYLDLSRRSDALAGASMDPDAQFSMRWSRDPVDAAFAVVLKALLKTQVKLTRTTALQLSKLAERRGKLASAAEARSMLPEQRVLEEPQPPVDAATESFEAEATRSDASPAVASDEQIDEAQQYRKMVERSQRKRVQMPFFQPFLPLVDAVLAMRRPDSNTATWAATRTALPDRIFHCLKTQDISEEAYLEAALDHGYIFLREDEDGRVVLSLEENGKKSRHLEDTKAAEKYRTNRQRQHAKRWMEPGTWSPLIYILRSSSHHWASLRNIARRLPADRSRIYQGCHRSLNLLEYLDAAVASSVVLLSRDSQGTTRVRWNSEHKHAQPKERTPTHPLLEKLKLESS